MNERWAPRCQGCGDRIGIARVDPGEDDTVPWRVWPPSGHSVLDIRQGSLDYRCRTGEDYCVTPRTKTITLIDERTEHVIETFNGHKLYRSPVSGIHWTTIGDECCSECKPANYPDTIEHETWLEYHDRLVREYYDVDAEWALIKEICPEVEKARPAPKPARRTRRSRQNASTAAQVLLAASIASLAGAVVLLGWSPAIGLIIGFALTFMVTSWLFPH